FSVLCFFFSSRRRHTRSKRDWSSDVCSSDLSAGVSGCYYPDPLGALLLLALPAPGDAADLSDAGRPCHAAGAAEVVAAACRLAEIGRASCRASRYESMVGEYRKTKDG